MAVMRYACVACVLASAWAETDLAEHVSLLQMQSKFVESWPEKGCDDGWGTFGQPLRTSQVVSEVSSLAHAPTSFFSSKGHDEDDLFVDVPSRFAFCRIQKVGSSKWDAVLSRILDDDTKAGEGFSGSVYYVVKRSMAKYGKEGAEKVFADTGATRAVFVREPLARFASAFLDKCLDTCVNPHCHMRKKPSAAVSMRDAVEWMLAMNQEELTGQTDDHWKLQSEHCDLKNSLAQFTVIGLFDKEHFSEDAACLMARAGLQRFNVPQNDIGAKTFWDESAIQKGRIHPHSGYAGATGGDTEEDMLKKLFTKKAAEKLIAHLAQEYDTFNFPTPSWVAHATGEWYEEEPQGTTCR